MSGGRPDALLVLADGAEFEGEAIGALDLTGATTGEVVFNTALSGYQEIVTDPSYAGQIITFTYPHIGNYGVNETDDESRRPFCAGVVVRDLARRASNWRATASLEDLLERHGVPGIAGVDTRRLTRHLRDHGALPGAFGTDEQAVRAAARGGTHDRWHRHGRGRHHRPAVPRERRRLTVLGGRLRLRHQAHHPRQPARARVRGRCRARRHAGVGSARP